MIPRDANAKLSPIFPLLFFPIIPTFFYPLRFLFYRPSKPTLLIMINHVSEIKAINLPRCDDREHVG